MLLIALVPRDHSLERALRLRTRRIIILEKTEESGFMELRLKRATVMESCGTRTVNSQTEIILL
jgi:hypothetical protein